MKDPLLVTSIAGAITAGTAVLIAATGEMLVEKTGVYNIGIEGMMLSGALAGFVVGQQTDSLLLALVAAIACGTLLAGVFGIAVIALRADMIMAGFALVFIATGLCAQLGRSYERDPAAVRIPKWEIPLLSDIPYVGPSLFKQMSLAYLAVLLPIAVHLFLTRTRAGLNLRTIGESPIAADAGGIAVNRMRMICILAGGAFAGLAGAFISLGVIGTWLPAITAGQGWIAFGLVIFAGWRPLLLLLGAAVYGAFGTLGDVGQAQGWDVPSELFSALPYIGTLLVLVLLAWKRSREAGWSAWPSALGTPFSRSGV
jgi:simple sugar transport system permease protein